MWKLKSQAENGGAGTEVEFNGKKYTLNYLSDTGIGPSDENGLTGCSSYAIPYFYNSEEKTIHFIKTNTYQLEGAQGLFLSPYLNWLALESSEGGSVYVEGIETQESTIIMKLGASYQDGGANGDITLSFDAGTFSLLSFHIQPQQDSEQAESEGDEPEGGDSPDYH